MARDITLRIKGDDSDWKAKAAGVDKDIASIGTRATQTGEKFTNWGKALMPVSVAVGAIGAGLLTLAKRGGEIKNVSDQFDFLTRRVKETGGSMLGALRQGTQGSIRDFDLMRSANLALGDGLKVSRDQMLLLASGAKLAADRVGGDTMQAYDLLAGAINRGSTAKLRQIGLYVDEDAALKTMADSLGIAVSKMSDQERSAAIQAGVLAMLAAETAGAAGAQQTLSDRFEGASTRLTNFIDRLSVSATTSKGLADAVDIVIRIFDKGLTVLETFAGWFERMPAPMQTVIVVLGGLLAAAGPVLWVFGQLATAVGAIAPLFAAGTAGAAALSGALTVLTGPVGWVIAAVTALIAIWVKWGDDIKRIVSESYTAVKTWLWDKLEPVLTPLIGLARSIGEAYAAFRDLMVAIGVRILASVVEWVGGVLSWIVGKLQPVFAPFIAAYKLVSAAFVAVKDVVVTTVKVMYEGVKTWLLDKFTAIVDGIKGKIDAVTGFFRDMYVAVVGGSYVPDMVEGIRAEFDRLPQVMVEPAQRATAQVAQSFFDLQGQLGGILQSIVGSLSGGGGIGGLLKGTLNQFGTGFLGGLIDSFVPGLSTILGPVLSNVVGKVGGFIKGIFGGGNDTKKDREKLAGMLGFSSLEGLNSALGQMGEEGALLLHQGLNVIGKKDKAANQAWIESVIELFETYKTKAPEAAIAVEDASKRELDAMNATKTGIKDKFEFLGTTLDGAKRKILGVAQGIAGDIKDIFSDPLMIPYAFEQVGGGPDVPGGVSGASRGGVVTNSGVRYMSLGGFVKRGTDTVPAMLTPGEGVLSRRGMNALAALNRGDAAVASGGRDRGEQHITVQIGESNFLDFIIKGYPKRARVLGLIR